VKQHLLDKRDELIWAVEMQGYGFADLCTIFNIAHRSTVMRIVDRRPSDWRPKWVKRADMDSVGGRAAE
jgi:hypothetical protein